MLFGFWVFLMSDAIIFGLLFATYATMLHCHRRRPGTARSCTTSRARSSRTCALLTSSFTFGMASLALKYKHAAARRC